MMNEFKNDLTHVYCKNLSPPPKSSALISFDAFYDSINT